MGKNYYLKDRDILDQALEHSWGKTADAKAKEKAYNREYYQRHKEEILRKARQAGEGIQRTAQNAYNTARREAQGIRDAVTNPPRRSANPTAKADNTSGWHSTGTGIVYNSGDFRKTAKDYKNWAANAKQNRDHYIDRYKEALSEGNRGLANEYLGKLRKEHTEYKDDLAISKSASNKYANEAKAKNEADKAKSQRAPESRFDSKLVRDAQNAYSKLRNPKEMARRAGESAKAYVDNATGKNGRRGSGAAQEVADKLSRQAKDQRSRANRFRDSARKSVQRSNSSYQQYQDLRDNPNTKGYAPQAYDNAMNEARRAIEYAGQYARNAKRSSASAAAANAASNAANRPGYDTRYDSSIVRGVQNTKAKARGAMTKAEKAAQQAREDAKKRMKKWFNR